MKIGGRARSWVYSWYARRLRASLAGGPLPRHVAMVIDGNRRWARRAGLPATRLGHERGAEHVERVLGWCAEIGIGHVTIFVLSADNLRKRSADELGSLLDLIERGARTRLGRPDGQWRLRVSGRLELLPDRTAHALKSAVDATRHVDSGRQLTIAVGYDGREEIVDAVRAVLDRAAWTGRDLADVAGTLTADDIAAQLPTRDQPDPDLIIRASGEQRLSGFLLWRATHAELYFCDVYWPALRHVDFLRALRSYAVRRQRRAG